jgi:hypothetical protein
MLRWPRATLATAAVATLALVLRVTTRSLLERLRAARVGVALL